MRTLRSIFSLTIGLTLVLSLMIPTWLVAPVNATQDPQFNVTPSGTATKEKFQSFKPVWTNSVSKGSQSTNILDTDKEKLSAIQVPFIQNVGQTNPQAKYYADTFAGTVFVTSQGLRYSFIQHDSKPNSNTHTNMGIAVDERFIGSYGTINPQGKDKSSTVVNYFIGNKDSWKNNVPTYNAVNLGQVWPQVDVTVKAQEKNIEKIFTIQPGANVDKIKISVDGINSMSVDNDGRLHLNTQIGTVSMTRPVAYQEINGIRHPVEVSYSIHKNIYGFEAGNYDNQYALVIDPLLASTFLGGNLDDLANDVELDSSGNVFISGQTFSTNFPTTPGAFQRTNGGSEDAFVSKLNPTLTSLLASTYIGGSDVDAASGITFDSSGNVYIAGPTFSSNFPTTPGAFQTTFIGNEDGFVSKFNNGLTSLLASTFIGGIRSNGPGFTEVRNIAHDSSGNMYITGDTNAPGYPTTPGTYKPTFSGNSNNFISEFNPSLTSLLASTFIGDATPVGLVLDSSGNVYISGFAGAGYPTTPGAYQTTQRFAGVSTPFISKLNPTLTSLLASTYIGGSLNDLGLRMALDSSGNVYMAGFADSRDYPTTPGAFQTTNNGAGNAIISKLNPTLTSLLASTFIGGGVIDLANDIGIDSAGNVYIAGYSRSSNYPTTPGAYQTTNAGGPADAIISKLNPTLTSLLASTFIGGTADDQAQAIAFDSSGNVYVTGFTNSPNFPTTPGAYQTTIGGGYDVFVSKLTGDLAKVTCFADEQGENEDQGETATQEGQEDQGEQGEQNEQGKEDCNGQ